MSKTIVIIVSNPATGYKGASIERNGKNKYYRNLTRASWERLAKVCRGGKREPLRINSAYSFTTKIEL